MSVKCIVINVEGLTDDEQMRLWWNLYDFARKELPDGKIINYYVSAKQEERK